jgi:hypothetical protein
MDTNALIDLAYRSVLGRDADPVGLRAYGQAIDAGDLDGPALVNMLINSDEFRGKFVEGPEERSVVNALVKFNTGFILQGGPFAGMKMLDLSNRGDGDISPKLLGTYEQELHPFIEQMSANRYDAIVDVGCAEGYFAVGLARLFKDTPVLAYDTDEETLEIVTRMARLNDCEDQIITGAFCDPAELKRVFEEYPRSLVIADCEGYEKTLFSDPATNWAGRKSDLIIECHDLWDDTITPTIKDALDATHDITTVLATGRNPNAYDFLAHLGDMQRFKAVWERRGARQNWLICTAR